ncbi:M48 family metallopeptidase [Sphingomonas sp.]|uniref:M48 family metallopeptidase n=1 Tax=Sphingomonas sp. TaxID=28214 RepID=UPI00286E07B3|nr:M48 family metallopeptidase [Sphingomonas sp.]
MGTSFGKIVIAAVALATVPLSSPAAAKPVSIRTLAAQEVRLAAIAYRIAAANSDLCGAGEMTTGMVLHDLTRYDRSIRPAVARAFSVNRGFGVLAIVPGSVAAEAGLRVDDEILSVGRFSVEDPAAHQRAKSFQRMDQFHSIVNAALKRGDTSLVIRRAGSLIRLPLRAQPGCGGKLTIMTSSALNAWADGRNILVTTGMAKFSRNDDEMSFVIAHEMAHNILGHALGGAGAKGILGFSSVKRDEIEADRFAVRLMAKAGFEPGGSQSFLEHARRRMWWSFSLDHPGFGRRIATVQAARRMARLDADPGRSAPAIAALSPIERPQPAVAYDAPAIRTGTTRAFASGGPGWTLETM